MNTAGMSEDQIAAAHERFAAADRDTLDITRDERLWLARQALKQAKQVHGRSKYVPHQGKREQARRVARLKESA